MKILRIYTKLPPLKGGMEKHIYNLTKLQIRDNHFVKVFFNDGEEISQNDEKICKLKLHRLKPQIIGFFIFYFLIVFKLLLKKQKFDIIHIHGDWSSLLFVKILKKLTNVKIVTLSLHDQLTSKYNHQKLLPKLVQDVDLIFSTGYDTANELEKLSGKKVIVQPSGINEIFFQEFEKSFESKSFTVITVANLFPKKNIEFVLNEEVEEIAWWLFVEKIILKSGRELKADGIFVAVWSDPNTWLVKNLNPAMDSEWCLVVDARQQTSIKGLYAAWDVTTNSNKFKQTIMSAAEWCLAANSVHEDMIKWV